MKYYIVVNEWKYPTETGREIVGDFDIRKMHCMLVELLLVMNTVIL